MSVTVKYRTQSTATGGGRDGQSKSHDGDLDVKLAPPKALGGSGDGVNPEQLLATGYAACFLGAMRAGAKQNKIDMPDDASVTADVGIGPRDDMGFGLDVELKISLPGMDDDTADSVIETGDKICPYSHATRGNINVKLTRV